MKSKSYDIRGVEGDTFITIRESFEQNEIIISISEAGKITGIIRLNKEGWEDLLGLRYDVSVNDK